MLLLLSIYIVTAVLVGGFLSMPHGNKFESITCGGYNLEDKGCNGKLLLRDATIYASIANLSMREPPMWFMS